MDMQTAQNSCIPKGGLTELEDLVRRDLQLIAYPHREWLSNASTGTGELDVLVIGGGQSGLSVAFGLLRQRIGNILVIDENAEGREGPWKTFARMVTLRTPKYVTGPDWGIPNLTFRAWYEAQFGPQAWEQLGLIPKEMWADYLMWYRKLLQIPVHNNTRAGAVTWNAEDNRFHVPVVSADGETVLRPKKIVLATGIDGSGRWDIPELIEKSLPRTLYAHTRHDIDFEKLKGKRVAVLGAGASAFDNASVALEAGAAAVHLCYRRKKLPNVNPYRWAEFVGFLNHHSDLPDDLRWRFVNKILKMGQLPPTDTYKRAVTFPNFHLHGGCLWKNIQYDELSGDITITTNGEPIVVDFIIVGTGFITDLSVRTELKELYPHIALWRDRYSPPAGEEHEDMARHPYLGANFEMQEKVAGSAPYLKSVFNYTFGCLPSMGFGGASISGMKYSLPKVVNGVTRQLYADNSSAFYDALENYDIEEF